MKNAMKKLMSLVLVAMILVSAVPFAASADSVIPVKIYQNVDGADQVVETTTASLSVAAICAENGISADEFEGAWVTNNGEEYKKGFGDSFGETSTLVKIRKAAIETVVEEEPVVDEEPIVDEEPVVDEEPIVDEEPVVDEEPIVDEEPVVDEEPAAVTVKPIKIVVKIGSKDNVVWTGEKVPANGKDAVVENLLSYCWNSDWDDAYSYQYGWSTNRQEKVSLTAKIKAGDKLTVMLQKKTASNTGNTINMDNGETSKQPTGYTKFAYPVYLNIYTDTTVGTVKKTINITNGIAADGRVSMSEVKKLVFEYYTSKSAAGIGFDGLYPAQGNWVMDYVADEKYNAIEGLYAAAADNYVYINVMLTNAKAISSSSSSNADSSNPKTGDEIYMAVTVMALSASALALGFYFNKKRAY